MFTIAVTVKLVPDTNKPRRIDSATRRLVREGIEHVLNPLDEYALEAALRIRESRDDAQVVLVSMAPSSLSEVLRKGLAMGADEAVCVSDPLLAGSDGSATALVLAAAVRSLQPQLILTGMASADGAGGYLPSMLAAHIGFPLLSGLHDVLLEGEEVHGHSLRESGRLTLAAALPAVASITKEAAAPRYASLKGIMAAKRKEIRRLDLAALGLSAQDVAACTEVVAVAATPARAQAKILSGADPAEAARSIVAFMRERKVL